MILNLKRLNKFVDYKHFKMESLQNVLELIRPGIYMASIDLKDAFYSVPIHKNHQAYLAFFVEEYLQKFRKYHFLFLEKKVSYL